MEQLTQNLKSGDMKILEVPFPVLGSGCVLVQNYYSIISAGTEGKTVKDARLGYIGKALARKDEVKKVVQLAKTIGIKDTYNLMMNKLDAPSPLGYSCSGKVIAIADDVTEFKVGDYVACGGSGAVHAEVISVSKNLCVKLPETVSCDEGTYTTLGAIALQGIRQAELHLGENCAVIGLGLIGQLTIQLLNASGVKSIGIDIDPKMISLAKELGANHAFDRNTEGLENIIKELTQGYGVDAVIITAGTNSTDPVDFAGEISRQKGKVIIVGNVPTGFKRNSYFKKELELKMSCSYGPGRYDRGYEEENIDYPYGYVRWTENRNMQAFVDLLGQKKINLKSLTSHTFDFKDAAKAYEIIVDKSEPYTGMLLKYNISKVLKSKIEFKNTKAVANQPSVAFIGAGSFANTVLLPALENECQFTGIVTNKPHNARHIADKYGFNFCSDKVEDILTDKNTNTVFIATRHNSHAAYVLDCLKNNKHVFVEKPLCLNTEELESIKQALEQSSSILMVGFNRRFSSQIEKTKTALLKSNLPISINFRINAGTLAKDHWIHDANIGGGRIVGEVCHFIDLVTFLANSEVSSVSANAMKNADSLNDTLTINLVFKNGSIANISYFSNGNKNLSKEYLEIFSNGQVIIIDDFKDMSTYGKSVKKDDLGKQDKGHKNEITSFINAIKKGSTSPIPFSEIHHSMLVTFKVEESIKCNGQQIFCSKLKLFLQWTQKQNHH